MSNRRLRILLATMVFLALRPWPLSAQTAETQVAANAVQNGETANATVSVGELQIAAKAVREFVAGMNLKAEHPQDAAAHLQNAIRLYPRYTSAYVQLGLTQMDARRWDEAEATLRRALAIDSNSAEANTALGIFLNRAARFTESQPVLRRAVQLGPKSASAHYELGLADWALSDHANAAAEARTAVELDPGFAGARVLLGAAFLETNDKAAALEQFRQALRIDPHGALSGKTQEMVRKLEAEARREP